MMRKILFRALAVGVLVVAHGCNTDAKVGVGGKCASTDECQGSTCSGGICVKGCSSDIDCPSPTICAKATCNMPLKVAELIPGVSAEVEGWAYANVTSLKNAQDKLGYLQLQWVDNVFGGSGKIEPIVDDLASKGVNVIIGASGDHGPELAKAAKKYPDIQYFVTSWKTTPEDMGKNLSTVQGFGDHGWYVAGKIAALKAKKRIGFVGEVIEPLIVRAINAFARGAQSVNPSIVTEVRWLGVFADFNPSPTYDYKGRKLFLEELTAQQMIDSGTEVIASWGDNGRHVRFIEAMVPPGQTPTVYSFTGNERHSWRDINTGAPLKSCLGSVYYDFSFFYGDAFDKIHHLAWSPVAETGYIRADGQGIIGLELNTSLNLDDTSARQTTYQLAQPEGRDIPTKGPYDVTGQLDLDGDGQYDAVQRIAEGQTLTDDQMRRTCWFVKGVVEKTNLDDPTSPDKDAMVPDGVVPTPPGMQSYGPQFVHCKQNIQH